ncbi:MAG: helix-turn-helix transcriptional regulator [Proteobacteria bacterium]|jgi:AcrR family transcriptional regulator|nr:helix-turn-helix transcriptional regulator [Pseudomonadota bacterium]
MMTSRQEKKQQTRALLLEVALRLFEERGVNATKTIDVAKAAGVPHGTVFAHFSTRDELVAAVVGQCGKKIAWRVRELAEEGATVREVLAAHLAGLAEHEAFSMLVWWRRAPCCRHMLARASSAFNPQ